MQMNKWYSIELLVLNRWNPYSCLSGLGCNSNEGVTLHAPEHEPHHPWTFYEEFLK